MGPVGQLRPRGLLSPSVTLVHPGQSLPFASLPLWPSWASRGEAGPLCSDWWAVSSWEAVGILAHRAAELWTGLPTQYWEGFCCGAGQLPARGEGCGNAAGAWGWGRWNTQQARSLAVPGGRAGDVPP